MEVGNVNSKHFVLALKVKEWRFLVSIWNLNVWPICLTNFLCYGFTQVRSVLDPCEDENEGSQDNEVSLGAESLQRDEYSDSDSEVNR